MTDAAGAAAPAGEPDSAPDRSKIVLITLILVAAVANLNLAVANVALPDIGKAFDSSQTTLDMIAVGYSLGLAASVLYLGALGDRFGRKMMLILGIGLSIPACIVAAWAPTDEVLALARIVGGLSAGMAFPTTLALITALWSGKPRTRAIALWSAIGGAIASLGPLTAGWLLGHFWWGSVFLVTLPLAVVALVMAVKFVPAHVNETVDPVDNLGGILSVVMVAGLVLAINFDRFRTRERSRSASRQSRSPHWSRSTSVNVGRGSRSTTSTSPAGGSSGWRRSPASSSSAR